MCTKTRSARPNLQGQGVIFKNWMLILVLLCENERQRWDASRYIKARSEAQRFNMKRDFYLDVYPIFNRI